MKKPSLHAFLIFTDCQLRLVERMTLNHCAVPHSFYYSYRLPYNRRKRFKILKTDSRPIFLIWRFKTLGFSTVAKGCAFCSRASSYIVKLKLLFLEFAHIRVRFNGKLRWSCMLPLMTRCSVMESTDSTAQTFEKIQKQDLNSRSLMISQYKRTK